MGTVTEIYDYLRLLYARIGIPHCYNSNQTNGQLRSFNNFFNSDGVNFRSDTVDQQKDNYLQSNVLNSRIAYTEPISKMVPGIELWFPGQQQQGFAEFLQ